MWGGEGEVEVWGGRYGEEAAYAVTPSQLRVDAELANFFFRLEGESST